MANPHPFPLNRRFGTLADGLGSSPLDHGAYPPWSHSPARRRWPSQFGWGRYPSQGPNPSSALPPPLTTGGSPKNNFGENQLSPSLIGLSPLSTVPPPSFQPEWVRAFTTCYSGCTLPMDSSLGFGSTSDYSHRPLQTRFRSGSRSLR
jgi:hypothetical protein